MYRKAFGRMLVIMVDDRLTGQLRDTHDAIGMVHTVFLYRIDRRIHLSPRPVEVRGMHVNAQRLA